MNRLTTTVILALVATGGCATPPAPRQADRTADPAAVAAIVDRADFAPLTAEVTERPIVRIYRATGEVTAVDPVELAFPAFEFDLAGRPLANGTPVDAGDLVAVATPTEEALATATDPLPTQVDVTAPVAGTVIGTGRNVRIALPGDASIVVAVLPDVADDLTAGAAATFTRTTGLGDVETGTITAVEVPEPASDGESVPASVIVSSPLLDSTPPALPYGTDLEVTFIGQTRPAGLVVDPIALHSEADQAYLLVQRTDGSRERVDVVVLAETADGSEITAADGAPPIADGTVVIVP